MAKEEKNEESEKKEEVKPKEKEEVKPSVEEKEAPTSEVPTSKTVGTSDKSVGESVGKEKKEEAPQEATTTTQPAQAQPQGSNNNGWKIFCCACLGCLGLIFIGLLIMFVSLGGVMGIQAWIAGITSGM